MVMLEEAVPLIVPAEVGFLEMLIPDAASLEAIRAVLQVISGANLRDEDVPGSWMTNLLQKAQQPTEAALSSPPTEDQPVNAVSPISSNHRKLLGGHECPSRTKSSYSKSTRLSECEAEYKTNDVSPSSSKPRTEMGFRSYQATSTTDTDITRYFHNADMHQARRPRKRDNGTCNDMLTRKRFHGDTSQQVKNCVATATNGLQDETQVNTTFPIYGSIEVENESGDDGVQSQESGSAA
ncbi:hypothetical protein LTR59_017702 [Friedmanniomyces endolithicus]|nr:hypothetical protein LTR59_017702 [Friedmanniomyces endolithicus]